MTGQNKMTKANLAVFIRELVCDDGLFLKWKGKFPIIADGA